MIMLLMMDVDADDDDGDDDDDDADDDDDEEEEEDDDYYDDDDDDDDDVVVVDEEVVAVAGWEGPGGMQQLWMWEVDGMGGIVKITHITKAYRVELGSHHVRAQTGGGNLEAKTITKCLIGRLPTVSHSLALATGRGTFSAGRSRRCFWHCSLRDQCSGWRPFRRRPGSGRLVQR